MKNNTYISKTNKLVVLITLLCLSFAMNAQSKYGVLNSNKAVNIAGKQRMLTQRMAKTYVYLVRNNNDVKAKRQLLTTSIIFEKQNSILYNNAKFQSTKNMITKVNDLWKSYKEILNTIPNYPNAEKIIEMNTNLLSLTNSVVSLVIAETKGSSQNSSNIYADEDTSEEDLELKKIINLSGKQRMLSQRLGLYYYATGDKLKSKNNINTLTNTFNKIDEAITELLISNFNTPKIDEKLGIAMTKWEEVKNNKLKLSGHKFTDVEMFKLSDDLTKAFNAITVLYEKIKL